MCEIDFYEFSLKISLLIKSTHLEVCYQFLKLSDQRFSIDNKKDKTVFHVSLELEI